MTIKLDSDDDNEELFDTLFAVLWCDLSFSFIEKDDADSFRAGIIHAKSFPDYPPPNNEDRHSALMQRGFDLFWKMRYFYAANKEYFKPDVPMVIVRDKKEIESQKSKRQNKRPSLFDFMR